MDNNPEHVIVGYAAMAECLRGDGFKYSRSTLTKIGSPALSRELPADQRLPIIGYSGPYPVARPSELRDWAWRRISPVGGDAALAVPTPPPTFAPAPEPTKPTSTPREARAETPASQAAGISSAAKKRRDKAARRHVEATGA